MENKPIPNQKGRYQLRYRGVECLNCGHPLDLSDRYCPNCSQANSIKKLSIKDFFDEFFGGFLSYDSRLFKTLSALLARPGKITSDYINGKRVTYTNPFRFLLSLAIIYFLMLGLNGDFSSMDNLAQRGEADESEIKESILDLQIENEETIRQAIGQTGSTMDSIPTLRNLMETEKRKDSFLHADPKGYFNGLGSQPFPGRLLKKSTLFFTLLSDHKISRYSDIEEKYGITSSFENKLSFIAGRSILKIKRQPSSFINSLISKLPLTTFLFLPVFALFVWMVYIRKKYNYTDHLIFCFHVTSLLFILLIISYLIDSIFKTDSSDIFIIIFCVYLFMAMKRFYGQGTFKTIVKYLFLNTIFFILAGIALLVLSTGSLITY